MTSNQRSFSEPHACWLMSPGGTDSMQISNWKRITQIHRCISAHTVTTVHSQRGRRRWRRVHADLCDAVGSGSMMKWDTQTGGMAPMLHGLACCIPSTALCRSISMSSSLPKDLPFEHRRSVGGDRNYRYRCAAKCSKHLMVFFFKFNYCFGAKSSCICSLFIFSCDFFYISLVVY